MTSIFHVVAPAAFGGIESVLRMLAAGQTDRGHRVGIVAVLDDAAGRHPFEAVAEGTGAELIPLRIGSRHYVRERRELRTLFMDRRPDVVHTHGYREDVQARSAARAARAASVATVHGFTGGDWKMRLYERLQERSLRSADAVIAVSQPIRERLIGAGVSGGRIHVIRNAWTPARQLSRLAARSRLGLPADAFVVGWVGRLSREKGCDIFLEALAAARDLPITACVVGEGVERPGLERTSRELGVSARITWTGAVDDACELFPAFDAFALSSRTEGTPIVLFEAMTAGVPIVAAAVGGVPEVLDPSEGWLTPPERPDLFADALRSLYRDRPGGARRARAARQKLADAYGVEPWLEAHDRVYRDTLDAIRVPERPRLGGGR